MSLEEATTSLLNRLFLDCTLLEASLRSLNIGCSAVSIFLLFKPFPMPDIFSTKKDTARRMWLKDVRVYLRLKFSALCRSMSSIRR